MAIPFTVPIGIEFPPMSYTVMFLSLPLPGQMAATMGGSGRMVALVAVAVLLCSAG